MPLDISHWPHFSVDSSLPPPPRCWSSDFFYICLILVLPEASLSEKSLMFSDKQSRSPSNHSPPSLTGELAEVLSLSLLSPSLASIGGSEQYKGIFLIGRKPPILVCVWNSTSGFHSVWILMVCIAPVSNEIRHLFLLAIWIFSKVYVQVFCPFFYLVGYLF